MSNAVPRVPGSSSHALAGELRRVAFLLLREPAVADRIAAEALATVTSARASAWDARAFRLDLLREAVLRAVGHEATAGAPVSPPTRPPWSTYPRTVEDADRVMARLPAWTRAAAVLRYGVGLPVDDTARVLRIAPADVERLLRDALAATRAPSAVAASTARVPGSSDDTLADPQLGARLRGVLARTAATLPEADPAELLRRADRGRRVTAARPWVIGAGALAAVLVAVLALGSLMTRPATVGGTGGTARPTPRQLRPSPTPVTGLDALPSFDDLLYRGNAEVALVHGERGAGSTATKDLGRLGVREVTVIVACVGDRAGVDLRVFGGASPDTLPCTGRPVRVDLYQARGTSGLQLVVVAPTSVAYRIVVVPLVSHRSSPSPAPSSSGPGQSARSTPSPTPVPTPSPAPVPTPAGAITKTVGLATDCKPFSGAGSPDLDIRDASGDIVALPYVGKPAKAIDRLGGEVGVWAGGERRAVMTATSSFMLVLDAGKGCVRSWHATAAPTAAVAAATALGHLPQSVAVRVLPERGGHGARLGDLPQGDIVLVVEAQWVTPDGHPRADARSYRLVRLPRPFAGSRGSSIEPDACDGGVDEGAGAYPSTLWRGSLRLGTATYRAYASGPSNVGLALRDGSAPTPIQAPEGSGAGLQVRVPGGVCVSAWTLTVIQLHASPDDLDVILAGLPEVPELGLQDPQRAEMRFRVPTLGRGDWLLVAQMGDQRERAVIVFRVIVGG